jgi:hypothetical protein
MGKQLLLALAITTICQAQDTNVVWNHRTYKLPDPVTSWNRTYYDEETILRHGYSLDLTNHVWWFCINPDYHQDLTNSLTTNIKLWARHGWFTLVWIDNDTEEETHFVNSDGAEGEGYYDLDILVDKHHPLAEKILLGDGYFTSRQELNKLRPPPEYGTWYAMFYHVHIYDWFVDRNYFHMEIPSTHTGIPTTPQIAYDTSEQLLDVQFPVYDKYGRQIDFSKVLNVSESDFTIEATTNLVQGDWFPVASGTYGSIYPEYDAMFFRLTLETPE